MRKQIRHMRIIQLRNMALQGCKIEELKAKCVKWGISSTTMNSYISEVVESIQKVMDKKIKQRLEQENDY